MALLAGLKPRFTVGMHPESTTMSTQNRQPQILQRCTGRRRGRSAGLDRLEPRLLLSGETQPNLAIQFDGNLPIPNIIIPDDPLKLSGQITNTGGQLNAAVRINIYFLPLGQSAPLPTDKPIGTATHKGVIKAGAVLKWKVKGKAPEQGLLGP